jgi:rubrerythrin
MIDEEFATVQQQLVLLGSLVRQMNLPGFIERIDRADAIGPLLNPTLYLAATNHRKGNRLSALRDLAQAANVFRAEVLKQITSELESSPVWRCASCHLSVEVAECPKACPKCNAESFARVLGG